MKKHAIPFLALLLTACAPPPPEDTMDAMTTPQTVEEKKEAHKHIHAAKRLNAWTITGAIAASHERKNWTATINWRQQGLNNYLIHLFGPLGGGSVVVEKKGQVITYQDGPKRIRTTNIDNLFYKETGVRVPLHNLYYWVRGVSAPGNIEHSQKDAAGHYTLLRQGGYQITYSNYKTIKGVDLPTKIRVEGQGSKLKLVIKHWKIR